MLLWLNTLEGPGDIAQLVQNSATIVETTDKSLKANLKKAFDASRELETSYRSLALFYKNTEADKLKNVTIINATHEQLKDEGDIFYNYIAEEFRNNYDKLDLRNNYSIMVIPGYLGSNMHVEKWAKIAHENKVMMVTDFENLETVDDVIKEFEASNLTGEIHRSSVMMACNWFVGRGKLEELGEEDDLMVPPSAALAGKVYSTLMSQVTAGKKIRWVKRGGACKIRNEKKRHRNIR